jgi:hypothetical protein
MHKISILRQREYARKTSCVKMTIEMPILLTKKVATFTFPIKIENVLL